MYFLYIHRWKNCQKTMEEILTQAIPTPAVMESKDPLPPAKNLLPKPPESKTPFQFQTVTNQPSEHRRKRPRPADRAGN